MAVYWQLKGELKGDSVVIQVSKVSDIRHKILISVRDGKKTIATLEPDFEIQFDDELIVPLKVSVPLQLVRQ